MLTVFTKETAGGIFRQFLKLIMLLFTVQFFHPVLLSIFSIYSGDNDDNCHLHISFHLKASPTSPPSPFFPPSLPSFLSPPPLLPCLLSAAFCRAIENAICNTHALVSEEKRSPKANTERGGERTGGEEGNSTCCHACLEGGLAQGAVFFQ